MKVPEAFEGRCTLDAEGRIIIPIRMVYGLGDRLFSMPAMSEYGRRVGYPCFDIITDRNADLYDHMPWVASITIVPRLHRPAANEAGLYAGVVNLNEGTNLDTQDEPCIDYSFRALGVSDTPYDDRRIPYHVTDAERDSSLGLLKHAGWRGQPILGTQYRGGQGIKWYRNRDALASLAAKRGWMVWEITENNDIMIHGDYGVTKSPTIRHVAALQSVSTAWAGFDSGPSYLACAVDCPTVFISGPVSVAGIFRNVRYHKYWKEVRNAWVSYCADMTGHSCWPGREHCPIRGWTGVEYQLLGGDCIDNINVTDIWDAIIEVADRKKAHRNA